MRAAKGQRRRTDAADFLVDIDRRCLALERALLAGEWRPSAPRVFHIRDPKPRRIGAFPFADRVVHHALYAAVEPLFEATADPDSYASRPGRGSHASLRHVQHQASTHDWYVKIDVEHYFETVPHSTIRALLDGLDLDPGVRRALDATVAAGAHVHGAGLPIGSLISQMLANATLGHIDRLARGACGVGAWARYMDDMLAFGPDKATVPSWIPMLRSALRDELGLTLKERATIVAPTRVGVPWLGFRVWANTIRLDAARSRRWRRRMLALLRSRRAGTISPEDFQIRAQSANAWAASANTLRFRSSFFRRHVRPEDR